MARRGVALVLCVLLAGASLAAFGLTAYAFLAAGFCAVLVVLAWIDLERRLVPNRIVLPAAVAVLAVRTAIDPSVEWTVAALGAAGFFLAAALVHPAGMGMGDVKLALLLGAMLGRSVVVAIVAATVATLVVSVVLFARHGTSARKLTIPYAPFLAFGGVVALFWGA